MITPSRCRRLVCVLLTPSLLVGQLTACTTWRVQNVPPQQFTVRDATQQLRVTQRSGAVVMLYGARISRDTLSGTHKRSETGVPDRVIAIPLQDVQSIAVRERDGEKTALFVTSLVLVVGVAVFVFSQTAAFGHQA